MSEWVRCVYGLPPENAEVLLGNKKWAVLGWREGDSYFYNTEDGPHKIGGVTHWLPLPELPKD